MANGNVDEDVPELIESDEDEWIEEDEPNSQAVLCLFSDYQAASNDLLIEYWNKQYNFNLRVFASKHKLDCFGFIQFVTFMRMNKGLSVEQLKQISADQPPWSSETYLKPVDNEDLLLQFDIESYMQQPWAGESDSQHSSSILQQRVQELEHALHSAQQDMSSMKLAAQRLVESAPAVLKESHTDSAYFESYSHYDIHREMLQDKVRTESYRDALVRNTSALSGRVVLDVGCGTGVLSMFAARAGASRVFAVDMSDVLYNAIDIIRENELDGTVKTLKGRMEDISLPTEKVDVIISEWMGYFLLYESMLDSIIWARDKYLAPGGKVYPDRCSLWISGSDDEELYDRYLGFWDDVYGLKMSCMKTDVIKEPLIQIANPDKIATDSAKILDLDICTCSVSELQFYSEFQLLSSRDTHLTSVIGHFDISFDQGLEHKVNFSTSASSQSTHWKQTVFLLDPPLPVQKGEVVECSINVRKDRKDSRSLVIDLQIKDQKRKYCMN